MWWVLLKKHCRTFIFWVKETRLPWGHSFRTKQSIVLLFMVKKKTKQQKRKTNILKKNTQNTNMLLIARATSNHPKHTDRQINIQHRIFSTHLNDYRPVGNWPKHPLRRPLACCSHMLSSFCCSEPFNKEKASMSINAFFFFIATTNQKVILKYHIFSAKTDHSMLKWTNSVEERVVGTPLL